MRMHAGGKAHDVTGCSLTVSVPVEFRGLQIQAEFHSFLSLMGEEMCLRVKVCIQEESNLSGY